MAGVGFPILKDTRDIPYLEGAWLKNFRDRLHTIKGTIKLAQGWIRLPQRENDMHLMQIFIESDLVDKKDLEYINYCRTWLQVEHLSDITTTDGLHIHPKLINKKGQ
eukprot:12495562-Ditylum_brightwellii.AAC.1